MLCHCIDIIVRNLMNINMAVLSATAKSPNLNHRQYFQIHSINNLRTRFVLTICVLYVHIYMHITHSCTCNASYTYV